MNQQQNGILIDYLRCTIHDVSVDRLKDALSLTGAVVWVEYSGFFGYPRRHEFHHISISYGYDDPAYFGGDESKIRTDMGIVLEMSGQGCRAFETHSSLSWPVLLATLSSIGSKVNFKRIDLAYDDHEGFLDLDQLRQDYLDDHFTAKCRFDSLLRSRNRTKDIVGQTIYIGSKDSPVYVCIYDKAAEREFAQQDDRHWVRVEIRLSDARAARCVDLIIDKQSPGVIYSGILANYCVFREPSADSNKSRWPVAPYWENLLNGARAISLWLAPGEEYNALRTREHLITQYGQTLLVLDEIRAAGGLYGLMEDIRKRYPRGVGKKYQVYIDEYRAEEAAARVELLKLRQQLGLAGYRERKEAALSHDLRWDPDSDILDDQVDIVDIFGQDLLGNKKET